MDQPRFQATRKKLAAEIDAIVCALPINNTPNERAVRGRYSHQLRRAEPAFAPALAGELVPTLLSQLSNCLKSLLLTPSHMGLP